MGWAVLCKPTQEGQGGACMQPPAHLHACLRSTLAGQGRLSTCVQGLSVSLAHGVRAASPLACALWLCIGPVHGGLQRLAVVYTRRLKVRQLPGQWRAGQLSVPKAIARKAEVWQRPVGPPQLARLSQVRRRFGGQAGGGGGGATGALSVPGTRSSSRAGCINCQ